MAKERTRIKIKDLPKGKKISREEMKKVFGGYYFPAATGAPDVPPTAYPKAEDFPPTFLWNPRKNNLIKKGEG